MPNFYSLFVLLLFSSTAYAGPTIVITGAADQNSAKTEFLGRHVPQSVVKNVDTCKSKLVIFNQDDHLETVIPDSKRVCQLGGTQIDGNVSTIAFTKTELSHVNYEELESLDVVLRTTRPLFVVDFGPRQDAPLWLDSADCWATATADFEAENTVYFCGKETNDVPFTLKSEKVPIPKTDTPTVISRVFAVAASNKYRVDKKKMEEQLEDEIQDIVEETMRTVEKRKKDDDDDDDEDDDDGNEFDNKHDPKRDHRLHCKYRKSCYETGKRGLIEKFDLSFDHLFHFWRAPESQQHHLPKTEDADQDGIPDSEDDDVDLADRKLVCKYRTECYKKHNIPLSDKLQERERSFMSAKLQAPQGKKRTLKDIAKKAVSGVKEREEEVKTRPVPKSLIVEKKLQAIEDQLQKKLDCKYRRSCYETGELPEIDESPSFKIPFFSSESTKDADDDDDDEDQKPFEEMEDLERKHYCKYRKSCYKTGEKPEIESELVVESFRDILEVPDLVETRKLTVQERCKYRKSCYKTGVIPDLSKDDEHIEKVAKKEVSAVIPSTVQDLKTLCKYRKSCYEEISEAPSVEIIQTIRKRRLIEKEVRKRRTRRHRRLHKRRAMMSRYGMTTAPSSKYEKVEKTQKELKDIADARETRKDAPAVKSVKKHINKKSSKVVEAVVAQKIVETVAAKPDDDDDDDDDKHPEPEPEVKKSKKSTKKVKEPEPEPESKEEPEPEPEPVKKTKRSLKKVKQPESEPEEEPEDPVPVPVPVIVTTTKKSSKKSREPVPQPDEPRDEEPEPVKHNKKSSKKSKEPEPEPDEDSEPPAKLEKVSKKTAEPKVVVAPKVVVQTEEDKDDDDDEGNEFDNKHDPKRDHRLHCKYRKTCYETGKKGLIEPFDFSVWHLAHFWAAPASQQHHNYGKFKDSDGDGTPDIEDKDALMADRKLSCKYRPSCYEEYGIPVGEKILEREEKRTVKSDSAEDDDDDDDDDEKERKVDLNAADRRLECKYRRSCYDSGVLPSIQQWSEAPTLSETIEISSKNLKMQKCKYRKSCYEAAGINDKESDDVDEEEKLHLKETLKPSSSERPHHHHHSKHHGKKRHQEPKESEEDDDDNDDDDDEKEEKQKKPKEEKKAESDSHKQIDQETLDKDLHLTVAEKSWCKYRKSCYSSVEPKAAKQDHSGSMARRAGSGQKCHIYYLSCREAMGLAPKEKAPIGPNGKRLCRKVKKDD